MKKTIRLSALALAALCLVSLLCACGGKALRSDLTQRELDVLRELTASLTNEEIGERLNISANTVKRHLQNLMEKTGFGSRLELALQARLLGLVIHDDERRNDNEAHDQR